MPTLTIDGRPITVPDGSTVLDAARALGIEIPTLCYREGCEAQTSCMVCVVRINGHHRMVPSCATLAEEGMTVESEAPEVRHTRRRALELLLGDHLGDCAAPCHMACPAHMDIPTMIRHISAGRMDEAIATVMEHIPFPATLGRICPELCERPCRRADVDNPVAIRLLKRYVGDWALATDWRPPVAPSRSASQGICEHDAPDGAQTASGTAPALACDPHGDSEARDEASANSGSLAPVAIVGAGPAGLSAAYYLLRAGHRCLLFDDHHEPGGALRYAVPEERLPRDVLDGEIARLLAMGLQLQPAVCVGRDVALADLRRDFPAVLLTTGKLAPEAGTALGLPVRDGHIEADRHTHMTALPGVFVAGSALTTARHAVQAVAGGRSAACAVLHFLRGEEVCGDPRPYSVHMGRLQPAELAVFAESRPQYGRLQPMGGERAGFSQDEARAEAERCLECDCRGLHDCKLRLWGQRLGASVAHFRQRRRTYERVIGAHGLVYEPGKCISCGLCVQIAERAREPLGLTFIGRGFNVRIGVPFEGSLAFALASVARECARACPTAALTIGVPKPDCLSPAPQASPDSGPAAHLCSSSPEGPV